MYDHTQRPHIWKQAIRSKISAKNTCKWEPSTYEGGFQADLDKALLGAIDGRAAGLHRGLDGLVADAGIGCQEDLHSLEPSDRLLAATHQGAKLVAFELAKDRLDIVRSSGKPPSGAEVPDESKMNQLLDQKKPARPAPFTAKQGQYLAFIWAYSQINDRPPAEADFQRYFKVTAPSVHQMLKTLDQIGLIQKQPGVARSIQLLVPPQDLPILGIDQPVIITETGH